MKRTVRKQNFTLIELLVVIAIIAILAAILMPALGKARNKTKSAACVNRLKQFGLAYQQYINDNHGWIWVFSSSGTYYTSGDPLQKYITADSEAWKKFIECPAVGPGELPTTGILRGGYLVRSKDTVTKLERLKEPPASKRMVMADSNPAVLNYYWQYADSSGVTANDKLGIRHDNGANFLHYAGHVRWYSKQTAVTLLDKKEL